MYRVPAVIRVANQHLEFPSEFQKSGLFCRVRVFQEKENGFLLYESSKPNSIESVFCCRVKLRSSMDSLQNSIELSLHRDVILKNAAIKLLIECSAPSFDPGDFPRVRGVIPAVL